VRVGKRRHAADEGARGGGVEDLRRRGGCQRSLTQRQQYLRYRDEIIPQAAELERMAEDSYRLGQTGINAYLQVLQASRDLRLRSIQSAADFQSALADLEQAIGAPIR
jgi:hypothetical protein